MKWFSFDALGTEDEVCERACDDCQHKENREQPKRLFWDYSQHYKGFIPAGRNHGRGNCTQAEDAVRIHRHGGKSTQTTGCGPQKRCQEILSPLMACQRPLPRSLSKYVKVFNHEHHDEDKACDHQSML